MDLLSGFFAKTGAPIYGGGAVLFDYFSFLFFLFFLDFTGVLSFIYLLLIPPWGGYLGYVYDDVSLRYV